MVAKGRDIAGDVLLLAGSRITTDINHVPIATAATGTTQARGDPPFEAESGRNTETTGTAATTDTLGKNAVRVGTFSGNSTFTIEVHLMAAAATGTAAPHAESAGKLAGPNADAEPPVSTAAANTLSQHPIAMITKGYHGVAKTAETDLTTFATASPGTAKTQPGTHATHRASSTETTRTAAAANTLSDHGMGIGTAGRNTAAAGKQHRTAVTTAAAGAAKTKADRTATGRPGNAETAVTTAAANTLG